MGKLLWKLSQTFTAHNTQSFYAKVLCLWENLAYQNFKSLSTRIPEGKTSKTFNYIPSMSQGEKENKCSVISRVSAQSRRFSFYHFLSKLSPTLPHSSGANFRSLITTTALNL